MNEINEKAQWFLEKLGLDKEMDEIGYFVFGTTSEGYNTSKGFISFSQFRKDLERKVEILNLVLEKAKKAVILNIDE